MIRFSALLFTLTLLLAHFPAQAQEVLNEHSELPVKVPQAEQGQRGIRQEFVKKWLTNS